MNTQNEDLHLGDSAMNVGVINAPNQTESSVRDERFNQNVLPDKGTRDYLGRLNANECSAMDPTSMDVNTPADEEVSDGSSFKTPTKPDIIPDQEFEWASLPGLQEQSGEFGYRRNKPTYMQLKQGFDYTLEQAMYYATQMYKQREDSFSPGVKDTFVKFKTYVNATADSAEKFREFLLQDGAVNEAATVQREVAKLFEKVKIYREHYEDVLSTTSTWAPRRRTSHSTSNTSSHRSRTSMREPILITIFQTIWLFVKKFLKYIIIVSIWSVLLTFTFVFIVYIYGNDDAKSINSLQMEACNYYKNEFRYFEMQPWKEGLHQNVNRNSKRPLFEDVYMQQKFYTNNGMDSSYDLTGFISMNPGGYPRRLILVADQGRGKSTAIKHSALNWCKSGLNGLQSLRMQYGWNNFFYEQGWSKLPWQALFDTYVIPTITHVTDNIPWWLFFKMDKQTENFLRNNSFIQWLRRPRSAELLFAFELRTICKYKTIIDAIRGEMLNDKANTNIDETVYLENILQRGIKDRNIILILDGFDEYKNMELTSEYCNPEVNLIVQRERKQNIHLILTSRSWKADALLSVERFGYQEVNMNQQFSIEERNKFISKFYLIPEQSQELISFLDNDNGNIIPEKMQREPRMLLYICNIWDQDLAQRKEIFSKRSFFFGAMLHLMMRTYNRKYPHNQKSREWFESIQPKLKEYYEKHKNNLSNNIAKFYKDFGDDELVFDLFCIGLFVSEQRNRNPWDELDVFTSSDKETVVNPAYLDFIEEDKITLYSSGQKSQKSRGADFLSIYRSILLSVFVVISRVYIIG